MWGIAKKFFETVKLKSTSTKLKARESIWAWVHGNNYISSLTPVFRTDILSSTITSFLVASQLLSYYTNNLKEKNSAEWKLMNQSRNKTLKRYLNSLLSQVSPLTCLFSTDHTLLDLLIIMFSFPLWVFFSGAGTLGQQFSEA